MSVWFYTVGPPTDPAVVIGQKSASAYARILRKLLPPGRLWRSGSSAYITRLLLGAGDELSRISGRVVDLLNEADPRTTSELLAEFERALNVETAATESERQARIVARLTQDRGFRVQDVQETLAPLLEQAAVDVVVLENSTTDAVVIADAREIYRYFVYRDPGLSGTADIAGAQAQLEALEHSHTSGHVIESIDFKCDEATSLCDREILGV